jgi:hypothetical protein
MGHHRGMRLPSPCPRRPPLQLSLPSSSSISSLPSLQGGCTVAIVAFVDLVAIATLLPTSLRAAASSPSWPRLPSPLRSASTSARRRAPQGFFPEEDSFPSILFASLNLIKC